MAAEGFTWDGWTAHRHERVMFQGVEERLRALGVRYLVLPSLRSLLPMWLERFGCQPLTLAEAQVLEDRIVFPDTDSAQLLKKALQTPECGIPVAMLACSRDPAGRTAATNLSWSSSMWATSKLSAVHPKSVFLRTSNGDGILLVRRAAVSTGAASVPAATAAGAADYTCNSAGAAPVADSQPVHNPGTLPPLREKAPTGEPAGPSQGLLHAEGAAHVSTPTESGCPAAAVPTAPASAEAAAPLLEQPRSTVQG